MVVYKNFQLSNILWYKTGGKARYLFEVENEEDVKIALDFIEKNHINKTFICGLGSNLIFSDDYFDGAVIRIATNGGHSNTIRIKNDGTVEAFAGEILDNLITFSLNNSLIGLEWAGGLPGTIGAGVRGNVGAFGGEIKDQFISAKVLNRGKYENTIQEITKEEFHFSYRNSLIKERKNLIVLSARFNFKSTTAEKLNEARETYKSNIQYRKTHHPIEYPTCGSVFKNVTEKENSGKILARWTDIKELIKSKWYGKVAMGYIIHRLGLTGYTVGKMQISEKHSNFIINLGGGSSKDVLTIIQEIQNKVSETFGFIPAVEVEIVS